MNPGVAVVYSPDYLIHLGGLEKLHSFDVNKYERIVRALQADGLLRGEQIHRPDEVSREDILRVHTELLLKRLESSVNIAQYLEAWLLVTVPASVLERSVLRPFRFAAGGTVLAGRLALRCGVAVNIGGGYHHAMPNEGGGFNIYNDLAIAVRRLQSEKLVKRAAVVDLDVHQGNGTAAVFARDDDVFTFSMHQRDIFPIPKGQSDLDVELEAGSDDATVLDLLRTHLPQVLDEARPDIVFYQAGCDTLEDDPLAEVVMTKAGIVGRDMTVIEECARRGCPVAMTLGGGYAPEAWEVQHASLRRIIETFGLAEGEGEE